jgi:hypothetical protein
MTECMTGDSSDSVEMTEAEEYFEFVECYDLIKKECMNKLRRRRLR